MKLLRRQSRPGSLQEAPRSDFVIYGKETDDNEFGGSKPVRVLDFGTDDEFLLPTGRDVLVKVSKVPGSNSENPTNNEPRTKTRGRSSSRTRGGGTTNRPKSSSRKGKEQRPEQPAMRPRSRSGSRKRSNAAEALAVDTYNMSMDSSSRHDKQIHSASDIYRNIVPSSASNRSGSRKNKKSIAPMPTLSEATTEEDESTVAGSTVAKEDEASCSFDSWDESNLSFEGEQPQELSPPREQTQLKTQPTVMQLLSMDEHRKACEQIKMIMEDANAMGAEGREEESIQTYKRALHLGRQDVQRVKAQLVKKSSFSHQFHNDWLEIGILLAEIRTAQATLYDRLLDYKHASACLQEAMSIHRRQATFHKPRSKEKALASLKEIQSLDAAAHRIQTTKKNDSKRKQIHEQILQHQRNAGGATLASDKAAANMHMEDTAQSLLALELKISGEQHPLVADANSLLGAIALERGNADTAIDFMNQALSIAKKSLGMKHPRTGTKLLHLASVYAAQHQDTHAIEHYNMSIAVFRSCSATKLVGSTLNDVAVIHIRRKEHQTAIRLLKESLEAYKQGDASWDTAQVWRNLGECYCQCKDFPNGSSALFNALNIQRNGRALLDKSEPSSESLPPLHLVDDPSIADTLRRLGKAYYGARKFDSALSYYKEACLIHKAEVKKVVHVSKARSSNLSLPARQDELAQTIYCMAELYDKTGESDQASKLFSESLQLRLFSDAHKETRSNMVHCAMCLYGLGGIHLKRGEHDEAANVVRQALSYCEAHGVPENNVIYAMIKSRLVEAERNLPQTSEEKEEPVVDPNNATVGESIKDLEMKAAEAIRQGDLDAAVWTLTTVMRQRKELLQSLKERGDNSASIKYDTACTLFTFGKVLSMRGDDASAEKALKDSLKLFKKSGTSPEAKIVLQLCEELQKIMSRSV